MTNASLSTIFAGLKPRIKQVLCGREYFQFHNGQIRRQVGQGHSAVERRARKQSASFARTLPFDERPAVVALAHGLIVDWWNRHEPPFAGPHIFAHTLAR